MKKLLLFFAVALLVGCAKDHTEDINAINNRLDVLEQTTIPSIESQIETINLAIDQLKEVDTALRKEIESLKSSAENASNKIAALEQANKAIETKITKLQEYVDSEIKKAKDDAAAAYATCDELKSAKTELTNLKSSVVDLESSLTTKIDNAVSVLDAKIADLEARLKAVEDKVESLLARIQSVSYIPTYDDGKATLKYISGVSQVVLDFKISPKECVAELAKIWESAIKVDAIYTETRAVSFVDMPIVQFEADVESGVISITASGENLSDNFFAGTQSASVALTISDGNNSVTSEYVPMVAQEVDIQYPISFKTNFDLCYLKTPLPIAVTAVWDDAKDGSFISYLENAKFVYDAGAELWKGEPACYWPTSGNMQFIGLCPYPISTVTHTYKTNGEIENVVWGNIDNNLIEQHDILYSDLLSVEAPQTSAQPLLFHHAYAQLNVTFKKTNSAAEIILKSVKVNDVYINGQLTITPVVGGPSTAEWVVGLPVPRFFLPANPTSVENGTLDATLEATTPFAPQPVLVIPGAQTSLVIEYTIDGHDHTFTHTLSGDWEMGYKYTYNYTINVNEIFFDGTVEDWNSVDGGYITI